MFEGFWTYCVEQAIEGTRVPRANLHEFTEDEMKQLGRGLGWESIPDAVWAPDDHSWFILEQHQEARVCQAMSINGPLDHNVTEWNEKIARDVSFRSHGKASVSTRRSGGWATKAIDNGFVQISLANVLLSAERVSSLSILTAIRLEQSPASCELFPSKCN